MRRQSRIARIGEQAARLHLEQAGYEILEANWHCPYGELDLVAECGHRLVIIEVKARTGDRYGRGEEAVTRAKLTKVERATWTYLESQGWLDRDWRLDVIAVQCAPDGRVMALEHYEDVLQR
jgi:putative endonuclease